MKKRTALDLTEGPVLRKLMLFAIPLIINTVIQSLYSTVDKIMVGQMVGSQAMAAVGASSQPLILLVNFFGGVAIGVNVVCGNLKGARKERELRSCMHTAVLMSVLAGFAVALLGIPLSRPLLQAMDTPAEILDEAVLYMLLRLAAGPVWLMGTFLANVFYAHGETRLPMVLNMVSGVANVLINALMLTVCRMGVEGVAIGTMASQAINAVVYTVALYSPRGEYKLRLRETKLHLQHAWKILAVGVPTGLNNTVFAISNVLLQSSVNSFGAAVVAGNSAADSLSTYVSVFMNSFASAALSATSQNYGAGKHKRIDEIVIKSCLGSVALVACAASLVTVFARPLLGLFVKKSEPGWEAVVEAGIPKLMFCSWGYIIYSLAQMLSVCLKGIREAMPALLCNMGGVILPRLVWVWFVVPYMHTPNMLYAIYPISWAISTGILAAVFLHYRKKKLLPQPQTA